MSNPVTTHIKTLAKCSVLRNSAIPFDPQVQATIQIKSKLVKIVNFDNVYCDSKVCFPVIGQVVVYRDANHLTSTFARTLAQYLKPKIDAGLSTK